jgi:hypothetical protein
MFRVMLPRFGVVFGLLGVLGLAACGGSSTHATLHTAKAVTKTVTVGATDAVPITMPCVDETTMRTDFVSAPVYCHIETKGEGLGKASLLKSLTWQNWGQTQAAATGLADCGGTGCAALPPVPAQVVVYRIVGHRYTRAKVTQRGETVVQRLDELPYEPPTETEATTPSQPVQPAPERTPRPQRAECGPKEELWELKGEEKGQQAVIEAYEAEGRSTPHCDLRGAAARGSVKAREEAEPGAR